MEDSPFSLTGSNALITGGGTGLGLATAQCFVSAGAKVVIVGRRETMLQQAVEQLGTAVYRVHDITDHDGNLALIEELESKIGPLDLLVNNAGNHLKKTAIETTEADFQSVLDTHLLASYSLARAISHGMLRRERGSILFLASMASFLGIPKVIAYTAAKTALVGLVRGLAAEFSPQGVRVNAIAPGWIKTPMLKSAMDNDPQRKQKVLSRTPMNRFGEPDDIGQAAVYLSSPAAKFVTGSVLTVDGGASTGF